MEVFLRCQVAVTVPACLLNVTASTQLQPLAVLLATLAAVVGLIALEDKQTKAWVLQ
jgi:hypothetical protein